MARVTGIGGVFFKSTSDQLESNGVEILKGPDSEENGNFAWIMDPDGNKVELWEPKISDEKK